MDRYAVYDGSLLNRMGQKYGRKDWIDESIHQVLMHIKYLCDRKTGLFIMAGLLTKGIISEAYSGAGETAGLPWESWITLICLRVL